MESAVRGSEYVCPYRHTKPHCICELQNWTCGMLFPPLHAPLVTGLGKSWANGLISQMGISAPPWPSHLFTGWEMWAPLFGVWPLGRNRSEQWLGLKQPWHLYPVCQLSVRLLQRSCVCCRKSPLSVSMCQPITRLMQLLFLFFVLPFTARFAWFPSAAVFPSPKRLTPALRRLPLYISSLFSSPSSPINE